MGDLISIRSQSTTIYSVDDHEVFCLAVADLVQSATEFPFGGGARTVDALIQEFPGLGPDDLVLLDLRLADGSSPLGNVEKLHNTGARVVVLTSGENPYLVRLAASTPALGVLSKSAPAVDLVDALRRAARGEPIITTEWAAAVEADADLRDARLSPREIEVLRLYAAGIAARTVAQICFIADGTVDDYLRRIREKYSTVKRSAPTKIDLYKRAIEDGFLPIPGQE